MSARKPTLYAKSVEERRVVTDLCSIPGGKPYKVGKGIYSMCVNLGVATGKSATSHIEEAILSGLAIGISPTLIRKLVSARTKSLYTLKNIILSPRLSRKLEAMSRDIGMRPDRFLCAAIMLHCLALEPLIYSRFPF